LKITQHSKGFKWKSHFDCIGQEQVAESKQEEQQDGQQKVEEGQQQAVEGDQSNNATEGKDDTDETDAPVKQEKAEGGNPVEISFILTLIPPIK